MDDDALRKLIAHSEAVPARPWTYRSWKYDDWGILRAADGGPVCSVKLQYRIPAGYDGPYIDLGDGHGAGFQEPPGMTATGQFVIACVDAAPKLAALLLEIKRLWLEERAASGQAESARDELDEVLADEPVDDRLEEVTADVDAANHRLDTIRQALRKALVGDV